MPWSILLKSISCSQYLEDKPAASWSVMTVEKSRIGSKISTISHSQSRTSRECMRVLPNLSRAKSLVITNAVVARRKSTSAREPWFHRHQMCWLCTCRGLSSISTRFRMTRSTSISNSHSTSTLLLTLTTMWWQKRTDSTRLKSKLMTRMTKVPRGSKNRRPTPLPMMPTRIRFRQRKIALNTN